MLKSLRVRISQGSQYIPDPRKANPSGLRAKPVLSNAPCDEGCTKCVESCPTSAIAAEPISIDLGRCVFCGDCAAVCPREKISFSSEFRIASTERDGLILRESKPEVDPVRVSSELKRMFGRSLKLRAVSAGGCNGCELEINALSNVNFDLGRYGIDFVASPRHADGLVLSGPITRNMAEALRLCWEGMPRPKFVIAVGACAISGGAFAESDALDRAFLADFAPSLYVPGCPPHPLTFVCGILDLLGIAT
jgi:Ni,Fe-hydrogenase III small subunit/Pyruvate/2-oxoacid:ferredoxin oxidoreductase delta subunit